MIIIYAYLRLYQACVCTLKFERYSLLEPKLEFRGTQGLLGNA
jgi:hypothetical protein